MAKRINAVERTLADDARDVRTAAERFGKQVISSAKHGLDRPLAVIPENPIRSVLLAAGAGALLGYFLGHRSR